MSKEFQIRDGNLIASFDLENEDGDIDFCKLLKVSHGVANEIGMFVDYITTNKIIKDQSKQIADLQSQLAEKEKENELMAKTLKMTKFVEKEVNQDKISFAIEQLEKVKGSVQAFDGIELIGFIDNQIKQLKEGK